MVVGRRVYIAGPMRGIAQYNFPAFDAARDLLSVNGFVVISPADIDRDHGFDPAKLPDDFDWNSIHCGVGTRDEIIKRDIDALLSSHIIYLLPGWQNSIGARSEAALAKWAALEFWYHDDAVEFMDFSVVQEAVKVTGKNIPGESILSEAERLTGIDRQADYGPPDKDFIRTAGMWTAMLQHKLAAGEKFEAWEVAQMMICVKLSRLQHSHKRDSVVDAAGYSNCMDYCYRAAGRY